MEAVLLQGNARSQDEKNSANIILLKSYVNQHLDSENLSLKWLAENYLFISIGYLSKLFIREEGIRFSDYLNQRRVDEAKRLMNFYQKENVKNIAGKVGFGSNPQYFSQVFKRYTGPYAYGVYGRTSGEIRFFLSCRHIMPRQPAGTGCRDISGNLFLTPFLLTHF